MLYNNYKVLLSALNNYSYFDNLNLCNNVISGMILNIMNSKNKAAVFAVLAAALYAINIPLSKLLLKYVGSTMMAAFLYLGAGIGILLCRIIFSAAGKKQKKASLTKKDMPYTVAVAEGSWSCKNERVLFNSSVFRSSIQYGDSR